MEDIRPRLVEIARGYIGTPFHHQGRLPGVGLDCAGVAVCALRECNIEVQDITGYARVPSKGIFDTAVLDHCNKISQNELEAGDFVMFSFLSEPQHIAIMSSPTTIIHAYSPLNKVLENSLDSIWQRRLTGCYRLKGL
jgi:cell wall-associated NlpC family hydrolase